MSDEVLVIDNEMSAAETFARLITNTTGLHAIATDNPSEAIEYLRSRPIRVIVLDQKMPEKSGTALFREIKAVDCRVKVIMLSGEAETHEVGEALRLGFDDYLHKNYVKELPDHVYKFYIRYLTDAAQERSLSDSVVLHKEKYRFLAPFRSKATLSLVSIQLLDDNYVFDDGWITIKQVNAGEEMEITDKILIEHRFRHEESHGETTGSKLGLSGRGSLAVRISLESEITSRFSDSVYQSTAKEHEVRRKYQLPPEPLDPSQKYVVSRHYQRAPVYRRVRAILVKQCEECHTVLPMPTIIYQLTSRIATRQINHFNDGSRRVDLTGTENHS